MKIKKLLGFPTSNRGSAVPSNWTFGWTPGQASAHLNKSKSSTVIKDKGQNTRQVGMYGVLAPRGNNGR
ncbi:hypothetical protein [Paraherbaspirillum soli]|uniref:Uncharacterized protein n=1 Tax=Paraherbaspirillum soli TaxID=631222 RepID=A0ABW0M6V4_9BURK